jgi:hypothetical protein
MFVNRSGLALLGCSFTGLCSVMGQSYFLNENLRLLNREQISFTVARFLYSIVKSSPIAIFRYVVTKFG